MLTLRATPIALSNKECGTLGLRVYFTRLTIDDRLLRLKHTSCFSLVVDANDFIAEFKLPACAAYREGFQHGEFALAVHYAAGVEFRDSRDRVSFLAAVEIRDFLVGEFECCPQRKMSVADHEKWNGSERTEDDRIGGEDGEVGMELLQGR